MGVAIAWFLRLVAVILFVLAAFHVAFPVGIVELGLAFGFASFLAPLPQLPAAA